MQPPTETISYEDLTRICTDALLHVGVPPDAAELVAGSLVRSEGEGAVSHGVARLPTLLRRLRSGAVDPTAKTTVVHETDTTAVLEGHDGIGQLLATQAMRHAMGKAAASDLGMVVVRNGSHLGRLGHFAEMAAQEGMIGLAATNASPRVVPQAGAFPVLGNNPWAMAIPTRDAPIVVDMANTVVAAGKIRAAKAEGQSIPDDWATDAEGRATTDPAAALEGALFGIGGHKGWAMSLLVDALTGVLSGGRFGDQVSAPDAIDKPQGSCHVLLAIRVLAFQRVEEYRARMGQLADRLREAGGEDARLPGERSQRLLERSRREGVAVRRSAIESIDEVLREVGLDGWPA